MTFDVAVVAVGLGAATELEQLGSAGCPSGCCLNQEASLIPNVVVVVVVVVVGETRLRRYSLLKFRFVDVVDADLSWRSRK